MIILSLLMQKENSNKGTKMEGGRVAEVSTSSPIVMTSG